MSSRFDTQDKLIDATREIIILEGVERLTVDNVCSKAGFTRGAFYSNFATKESLLAALAEVEYERLIESLNERVESWRQTDVSNSGEAHLETLLFDAMDDIGVNRALYAIHTEMQARSVRNPEWAVRLKQLNDEFLSALRSVLKTILKAAKRKPELPMGVITHAVVGVVLRAAGLDALAQSEIEYNNDAKSALINHSLRSENRSKMPESTSIVESPAREIIAVIVPLLYCVSRPE